MRIDRVCGEFSEIHYLFVIIEIVLIIFQSSLVLFQSIDNYSINENGTRCCKYAVITE